MNPFWKLLDNLGMIDRHDRLHQHRHGNDLGHNATPAKGKSHAGSNNHGRGESKVRHLMAKESRRINRRK
jgi:hypothetical protein